MKTAAIIVAAGRGTRAGGGIPKQWQQLGAKPVAAHAMQPFADHPAIAQLLLVVHPNDLPNAPWPDRPAAKIITGGATRQDSVLAGLRGLDDDITHVLIHDAARPLVSKPILDRVLSALASFPGAAPALPVADSLWFGMDDLVSGMGDRKHMYRAQTPQGFAKAALLQAHAQYIGTATDDVAVAHAAGLDVAIVPGDETNIKITTADDFARALRLMGTNMDIRIGNGYDVHRFGSGDHVWLCGVKIPFTRSLQGHSDADVGMHAVTDAIYGALGKGDIGQHFPPSDPQWKGAASDIFLKHACQLSHDLGYKINNIDCTLVCEAPKIGPHQAAMKQALADITCVPTDRISVKATTSERLGFTGREEGIASLATVSLVSS